MGIKIFSPEFEDILDKAMEEEPDLITESYAMIKDGWKSAEYPDGISYEEYCEIADWVEDNIKGPNKSIFSSWYFKDPKDYMLFVLRWSDGCKHK